MDSNIFYWITIVVNLAIICLSVSSIIRSRKRVRKNKLYTEGMTRLLNRMQFDIVAGDNLAYRRHEHSRKLLTKRWTSGLNR
ncbi:membrane protein [Microbacterium phage Pumpernickel]|uniref:Membrane protein n=1 Tax=Microbacterium phage Pumpernickel TaxID=2885983 RepID=A0AAE8Y7T4_9CAUD|nr:membrane protein [Microbacterium phage Pumpernickel]UDL16028.1 membrane protein [Microbacterium phage Pumpernickel]